MSETPRFSAALDRLGGDRQLFDELTQFFFEDAPGLMSEVEAAAEQNNAQRLERAAHSLKGLALNFDADAVVVECASLEEMCRQGQLDGACTAIPRLREGLETLSRELKEFRQGPEPGR